MRAIVGNVLISFSSLLSGLLNLNTISNWKYRYLEGSMPIYAYECRECGVRFERRQGFNDAPISVCPECEGSVHRLIQPAGVIFKGSGFYVTDNRGSKSGASGSKSEAKAEAKSDGGPSEGKSEAKAEKKSESKASKPAE